MNFQIISFTALLLVEEVTTVRHCFDIYLVIMSLFLFLIILGVERTGPTGGVPARALVARRGGQAATGSAVRTDAGKTRARSAETDELERRPRSVLPARGVTRVSHRGTPAGTQPGSATAARP